MQFMPDHSTSHMASFFIDSRIRVHQTMMHTPTPCIREDDDFDFSHLHHSPPSSIRCPCDHVSECQCSNDFLPFEAARDMVHSCISTQGTLDLEWILSIDSLARLPNVVYSGYTPFSSRFVPHPACCFTSTIEM